MKLPAWNVAWLLQLFLTACIHIHITRHKPVRALPPSIHTKLATTPIELSDAELMIPIAPLISDITDLPEQSLKPPIKRKKPVGDTQLAAGESAGESTGESTGESAGVSAIGQLSSGDLPAEWHETADSITATESGLNNIHRTLSTQERKTGAQIRQFLKQAKEALDSGDIDGAQTLVAKAKVLLKELTL
jgi:hypothetical protein